MLDLPPASFAVTCNYFGLGFPYLAKERFPDGHRDLVLLLLQAVRARDAAAVDVELDHPKLRHEREQIERGLADPVATLLARCVVRNLERHRLKVGAQLAFLVEKQQEL